MKHANSVWRLILCGVIAFLSACTSADKEPTVPGSTSDNENATAIDRAIEEALGMIHSVEGATTRADERTIESVTPILRHVTRSLDECGNDEETDGGNWYVVNYADSRGFSVVTDADVPCKVFGFSDTGHFSLDEADLNPALKRYLDILVTRGIETYGYAFADAEGGPALPPGGGYMFDTISGGGREPFPDNPVSPITLDRRGPYLNSHLSKWDQGYPYHMFTPLIGNEHTAVGCTAVACGLIITYHGWPLSYGGNVYDYASMKNLDFHEHIAILLVDLGLPGNLNIEYRLPCDGGSSAFKTRFIPTFHNFGYNTAPMLTPFNEFDVVSQLNVRKPVLVRGSGNSVGHAWVVDGYYKEDLRGLAADESSRYVYYFRNVWGWGGLANGYYRMNTSVEYHFENTSIYGSYNGLEVLLNISPNK